MNVIENIRAELSGYDDTDLINVRSVRQMLDSCTFTERPKEPFSVKVSKKEPDEISEEVTVRFFANTLKCRWRDYVIYNIEWLKKNWQMEMDIVCGVKPTEECDNDCEHCAYLECPKDDYQTDIELIVKIDANVYARLFDNGIQDNEIATDDICEMARTLRLGKPFMRTECPKEPCEDAVSRQAVLDLFEEHCGESYNYGCVWGEVEQLPSVQPKAKTGHFLSGTHIPDNATNGDVFNAIYADISRMGTVLMDDIENIIATNVNIGWWNSPYQKGGAE